MREKSKGEENELPAAAIRRLRRVQSCLRVNALREAMVVSYAIRAAVPAIVSLRDIFFHETVDGAYARINRKASNAGLNCP